MPDRAVPAGTRRVIFLAVAVALLISSLCTGGASASTGGGSDPKATASVIGGNGASISQYPSLAYIEGVQATSAYACTGTVVAPRIILTAAHCVEDIESSSIVEPGEIAAVTGVSNLRRISAGQISYVERALVDPSFDPAKLHGDAGLLVLSRAVSATPITLADSSDSSLYDPGDELTVAGWGVDDEKTEQTPYQLQAATVPVEENSRCRSGTLRFYPFLDTATQFCTLDSTTHKVTACHGDSGGPAIATRTDGTQVELGIVSLGNGTCDPRSPAIYTRTDQISSWVQEWIDAVEHGGAEPEVKVPKAHLPLLTRERTEELSALAMEEAFGDRFAHGQEGEIRCDRRSKARLKCDVSWDQGGGDYYGQITVFYAIRQNVVLAGVHYTIHRVNDYCYHHSGEPRSCRVQTSSR